MSARSAATASYTERFVHPGKKHTAAPGADRSGTTLPGYRKSLNNRIEMMLSSVRITNPRNAASPVMLRHDKGQEI